MELNRNSSFLRVLVRVWRGLDRMMGFYIMIIVKSRSSSAGRASRCQRDGRGFDPRLLLHFKWRHSQEVRRRSAKPLFTGSNPVAASSELSS